MFKDCVESCPEELAPTDGSMTCKTCEEPTPYWGIYEQKCVACKRNKDGMLCVACDENTPYWDGKECKACGDN